MKKEKEIIKPKKIATPPKVGVVLTFVIKSVSSNKFFNSAILIMAGIQKNENPKAIITDKAVSK